MSQTRFRSVLMLLRLLAGGRPVMRESAALDRALERLRTTRDAAEADRIDTTIWRLWCGAGSRPAVGDLAQALQAMALSDFITAKELLDRAIMADPGFPEAWNRRAMVHFLTGETDRAVADIEHVLVREPRHYGALSGLGQLLLQEGEPDCAILAFEAALSINPHLGSLRKIMDRLRAPGSNREPPRQLLT